LVIVGWGRVNRLWTDRIFGGEKAIGNGAELELDGWI
jgi:hypothetical protein